MPRTKKEQAEFTGLRQESNEKSKGAKEITVSTTDPDFGFFHKEEHKVEFAYTCKKGIDDGKEIMKPYKKPMTKKEFFHSYEFVYNEYYDCAVF